MTGISTQIRGQQGALVPSQGQNIGPVHWNQAVTRLMEVVPGKDLLDPHRESSSIHLELYM